MAISKITAKQLREIKKSQDMFAKHHYHFGFSPLHMVRDSYHEEKKKCF